MNLEGLPQSKAEAQATQEMGAAPTLSAGVTAQNKLAALKLIENLAGENANLGEVDNDIKLTQEEFDAAVQQGLVDKADAAKYLSTEEAQEVGEIEEAPAASGEGVQSRLKKGDDKTRKVDENGNPLNRMRKLTDRMARIAEKLGYGNKSNQSDAYKTATGMTPKEVDAQNNAASAEAMQEAGAQPKGGDASPYNLDNYDQAGINKLWKDRKMTSGQYAEAMVQKGFWSETTARNFLSLVRREGDRLGLNTAEERKRDLGNYTIGQNNAQNAPQGQAVSEGTPAPAEAEKTVKPQAESAEKNPDLAGTAQIESDNQESTNGQKNDIIEAQKGAEDGGNGNKLAEAGTETESGISASTNGEAGLSGSQGEGIQEGEERTRRLISRSPRFSGVDAKEKLDRWVSLAKSIEDDGGYILSRKDIPPTLRALRVVYENVLHRPITFYEASNMNKTYAGGFVIDKHPEVGAFVAINHPESTTPGVELLHEGAHIRWEDKGDSISRKKTVKHALAKAGVNHSEIQDLTFAVLKAYGYRYVSKNEDGTHPFEVSSNEEWKKLSDDDRVEKLKKLSDDDRNKLSERLWEEIGNWLLTDDPTWTSGYTSLGNASVEMQKALVLANAFTEHEMSALIDAANGLNKAFANKAFREEIKAYNDAVKKAKPITQIPTQPQNGIYSVDNPENKKEKTLVAIRNMSLQNALRVLTNGRDVMPSIALMKASRGYDLYGPVSFIYRASALDPSKNSENRIYGGDAFTPRRPHNSEAMSDEEILRAMQEQPERKENLEEVFGDSAGVTFVNSVIPLLTRKFSSIQDVKAHEGQLMDSPQDYYKYNADTVRKLDEEVRLFNNLLAYCLVTPISFASALSVMYILCMTPFTFPFHSGSSSMKISPFGLLTFVYCVCYNLL